MADILLLNGPNLNLLGTREPSIYGRQNLSEIVQHLHTIVYAAGLTIDHLQSNREYELLERIHAARTDQTRFILINPAAFTHTSIALRDALLGVSIPFIEIHLSNVHARESFRHHSYFSDIAQAVLVGLGSYGYELGVMAAIKHLQQQDA